MKNEYQKINTCPMCGSKNIEYGTSEVESHSLYYDATCKNCKTEYKEYFALEFSENVTVTHVNSKENTTVEDIKDSFKTFDLKILEAKNNGTNLVLSEEDIETQTEYFRTVLISFDYTETLMEEFMREHYQNLNTTRDNLFDFVLFLKNNK